MFKKTLICLDGSRLAEEILPYAAEHCLGLKSEVILLQVITAHITIPPPESTHVMTFGLDSKPDQIHTSDVGKTTTLEPKAGLELREIEREQGEAKVYLDNIAARLHRQGLKAKTVTLEGDVSDTILNFAASSKISMIALTTHGRSGLKSQVLGRVAAAILKTAEIPVLLIKPKGKV
jgi:nucleotide-binding universal stress UspA family protein